LKPKYQTVQRWWWAGAVKVVNHVGFRIAFQVCLLLLRTVDFPPLNSGFGTS
jgi:hypothetical protein